MAPKYSLVAQRAEEFELQPSSPESDLNKDRNFSSLQPWYKRMFDYASAWIPVSSARYRPLADPMSSQSTPVNMTMNSHRNRLCTRGRWLYLALIPTIASIVVITTAILVPSYHHPPDHYKELHERTINSGESGRANINKEKVFIATSLYDGQGDLVLGSWVRSVLELVDILGPENVFLSLYKNDPDPHAKTALDNFSSLVKCNASIVSDHIDSARLPHVALPNGEQHLKRIAFLAEIRNRALKPLENGTSPAYSVHFDKLLYLDQVAFNPVDAANLLFSTNLDEYGKTQYRAACATDFINPFKFSDTFATRDLEGNSVGLPFFPWFTTAGNEDSRRDVLRGSDAVRVRSCWGGLVAFDTRWFQPNVIQDTMAAGDLVDDYQNSAAASTTITAAPSLMSTFSTITTSSVNYHPEVNANLNMHYTQAHTSTTTTSINYHPEVDANLNWHLVTDVPPSRRAVRSDQSSLRFRYETDTFWDASECCLMQADLQESRSSNISEPTGIYMNPYIRVAYDDWTLRMLHITRRFELLYTPLHRLLNSAFHFPQDNPRRTENAGEEVVNRVWKYDDLEWMSNGNRSGRYRDVTRIAQRGGFCGARKLLVMDEEQEHNWWHESLPQDDHSDQ